jgi:alpha-L-fucosidase
MRLKMNLFLIWAIGLPISLVFANAQQSNTLTDSVAFFQAQQLQQTDRNTGSSNNHPDAQWFPKAGLGLFIHWGMTAVNATGDLSWNMLANKPWQDATVTPNNYYKQLDKWVPDKMNFDKMLKAAKAAGVTYAVFVTRHHDGFALWPSEYGELGTKTHFEGRDFVREFVEACRKNKLKIGLYYSPPDWYYERKYKNFAYRFEVLDMNHKPTVLPEKTPEYERQRLEYLQNQVTELLTNYGKIDLLWFDGGRGEVPHKLVRSLQPGIVINRRNGAEGGDYGDTEGKLPKERFVGWFETCETCWPSRKWAYTEDAGWDTAAEVLTSLVKLRAWGGNLLANVGPKASGEVPKQALYAWQEMADWMRHSREAVIGAYGGPWPEDVNTPVTTNQGVAYIHLLPGEEDEVVWKNAPNPKKVFMLRTKKDVSYSYEEGTLKLNIPKNERTKNVDVVKLLLHN